jgi:hypothetical protein
MALDNGATMISVANSLPANLEEVYGSMKDALKFFGLRWGSMRDVRVGIRGSKLVLAYDGSEIALDLSK